MCWAIGHRTPAQRASAAAAHADIDPASRPARTRPRQQRGPRVHALRFHRFGGPQAGKVELRGGFGGWRHLCHRLARCRRSRAVGSAVAQIGHARGARVIGIERAQPTPTAPPRRSSTSSLAGWQPAGDRLPRQVAHRRPGRERGLRRSRRRHDTGRSGLVSPSRQARGAGGQRFPRFDAPDSSMILNGCDLTAAIGTVRSHPRRSSRAGCFWSGRPARTPPVSA